MDAALKVRGLAAGYAPGVPAIEGVDLDVAGGHSVAVLGPNGGGKTTLFRALLGQTPWRRGEVVVRGSLAYVPQTERSRLDFPIDALGVVLMGRYRYAPWYRRLGRDDRRAAREALDRVGLGDHARTRYGELSGGQRQRVLIARALAQEAGVLLMDEPMSGVDRPSAELVLALLEELRDEGRIVLVSTHDIDQARRFDSVLCINRDQVGCGRPDEVLTAAAVARTYGAELVRLADGEQAVVVQHHSH